MEVKVTGTDLQSEHLGHVPMPLAVHHGVFGRFSVLQQGLTMNGICCVELVLPVIRVNGTPSLNGDYLQQLGFLEFSAVSILLLLPRRATQEWLSNDIPVSQ